MPRACALRLALAWIERNRSAPSRLAIAVRSSSGMKTSVSRVITTSMPGCFSSSFWTRSATSSVSSASLMPLPCAPGSWPPWPASMTMRETPSPSWRDSENLPFELAGRRRRRQRRLRARPAPTGAARGVGAAAPASRQRSASPAAGAASGAVDLRLGRRRGGGTTTAAATGLRRDRSAVGRDRRAGNRSPGGTGCRADRRCSSTRRRGR